VQKLGEFIQNIPIWAYKKLENEVKKAIEINEEKRNRQLEALKVFSMWADLIPQDIFDKIILNVNTNLQLYWLDRAVDIENWILWFDTDFWDERNSFEEIEKFYQLFVNKAITWNKNYPVKFNWWRISFVADKEWKVLANKNIIKDLLLQLWSEPLTKMMINLKKSEDEQKDVQ
jgi:hypothetical protein